MISLHQGVMLTFILAILACISVLYRFQQDVSTVSSPIDHTNFQAHSNVIKEGSNEMDFLRLLRGDSTDDGDRSSLNLRAALDAINDVVNLVYQRFEFKNKDRFQFFIGSSNMPGYAWDLMKYKIAKKILLKQNETYLMIFGGSSVTAGHDNYYHQAYPFVFERRMKNVFEALGMQLAVHNIAQGSNNCRPADYCYEAMGGEGADFIVWEQSFNCGRAKDIMEYIARIAYWSGAVIYYSASGAFLTNGCKPTTDKIPWTSEEWTPEKEGIQDRYEVDLNVTQTYRQLMSDWYDDGNSVSRFTNQVYGGLYKGVGPHGYSVWGHSGKVCNDGKGCTAVDEKGPCFDQGGPHWMIAETSYYAGEKNKIGKNWHPPAGMHLMRGEILAYNMAHILADTLFMIQADTLTMSVADAIEKYDKAWEDLRSPIPEKAMHLHESEGAHPAKCFTNFRPHFEPKYLLNTIVVGNENWKYVDVPAHNSVEERKFGYKDDRPFFESTGASAKLHFRIDNVQSKEIRICGYMKSDSLKHAIFYLEPDVKIPTDITGWTYSPSDKKQKITNRKFSGDECTLLKDIPVGGSHILTVESSTDSRHRSYVTHVIVF